MSDLPLTRIDMAKRVYSNTVIDFFGPFLVYERRKTVKRWRVIFTCLMTHAIHLEIACKLTTDSCLKAIMRFLCQYSYPTTSIYSDNGTNFRGSDKSLKTIMKTLDHTQVKNSLRRRGIKWILYVCMYLFHQQQI